MKTIHIDSKAKYDYASSNSCLKVIATTDSSLLETTVNIGDYKRNPNYIKAKTSFLLIPQSFIDKYISEYNKGNKIEKVMVEWLRSSDGHYDENDVWHWKELGPKLNSDNTINIQILKDNWNREEVINMLNQINCLSCVDDKFDVYKWIENNL